MGYLAMSSRIELSILDQSLIPKGGNAIQALQNTIETAKLGEQLGYKRFWVSEHHNLASIAGSAPEILMAKIANETKTIRVGSGGIMLPNHSALKVAENFRLLEGLYPGRIDLGIGRAPGGDRISASLLNPSNDFKESSYLQQLDHLQIFFKDEGGTQFGRIIAVPQVYTSPEQWMLSSSGGSSKIAASYGMGLAIAKFISGQASSIISEMYKKNFKPSDQFPSPKIALSIVVLCADTEEKASQLKKCVDYQFLQIGKGLFEGISDYETLQNRTFSDLELELLTSHQGKVVYGTPDKVKKELLALCSQFEAEEIIVATWAANQVDRLRSFELLASAFDLAPQRTEFPFLKENIEN